MDDNVRNGGVGFGGTLTLIFITLKLVNVISWSWWWILSPLWLPWVLVIIFTLIYIISSKLKNMIDKKENK